MKTVRSGDLVERVSDDVARARVSAGWAYCKKDDWRKAHPDKRVKAKKEESEEPVLEKKVRWEKAKREKAKAEAKDAVAEKA